jgi:hypothetical protein
MASHAMPLDRISANAHNFRIGRALQWLAAALLLAVGFTAHKVVRILRTTIVVVGYCLGWVCVAVREGWREAAKT